MGDGEWKPGDVAISSGRRVMAAGGEDRICFVYEDGSTAGSPPNPRPLVVIDPEDCEQVDRLRRAVGKDGCLAINRVPALQAALRSLITPPKPEEPTGLGAVVEDADGEVWVRHAPDPGKRGVSNAWYPAGYVDDRVRRHWDTITAVKILSPGVTA